jgi:ApbE superfamily uncharacterized protein (UPF0280 family)
MLTLCIFFFSFGDLFGYLAPNACSTVDAAAASICDVVRQYGASAECAVSATLPPAAATTPAGPTTIQWIFNWRCYPRS